MSYHILAEFSGFPAPEENGATVISYADGKEVHKIAEESPQEFKSAANEFLGAIPKGYTVGIVVAYNPRSQNIEFLSKGLGRMSEAKLNDLAENIALIIGHTHQQEKPHKK